MVWGPLMSVTNTCNSFMCCNSPPQNRNIHFRFNANAPTISSIDFQFKWGAQSVHYAPHHYLHFCSNPISIFLLFHPPTIHYTTTSFEYSISHQDYDYVVKFKVSFLEKSSILYQSLLLFTNKFTILLLLLFKLLSVFGSSSMSHVKQKLAQKLSLKRHNSCAFFLSFTQFQTCV